MNKRFGAVAAATFLTGAGLAQAAPLLVDFNGTGSTTQSGWSGFAGTGPSATYEGVTVTVSAVPTSVLQGRDRGASNPTNSGAFTLASLYRDFLYVDSGNGVNVVVSGLTPNATYGGTIWSYDWSQRATAPATFAADWSVNGDLVADNYSFAGWGAPTSNTAASFTFETTANASGQIQIQGLKVTGNGVGINGLQLDVVPEPASLGLIGVGALSLLARRRASRPA